MAPNIYKSPYPQAVVPSNSSVWQHLAGSNIDDIPDDKIIWQEYERPDKKKLTYGDAPAVFARGAAGLLDDDVLGLKPSDTVMLMGTNSLDWVILAHSAIWAGIVPAGVSPLSAPRELVHFITISESRVVFCEAPFLKTAQEAISMLPSDFPKPKLVALGDDRGSASLTFPQDFMSPTRETSPAPLDLSNRDNHKVAAAICFSSGTSGKPKAVMLSHRNLLGCILGMRSSIPEQVNSSQNEVFYAPLYHIYGLIAATLSPAYSGATTVLIRRFTTTQDYVRAATKSRATILRVVPPTAVAMAKDPWVAGQDLGCVHTILCAGAVLAPEIISRLDKLMPGAVIVQGYGMSEAAVTALRGSMASKKAGSVGRLMSHAEIRIVDDDLNDVPTGATGEILTRGSSVFMEYKNNPSATAEAFPLNDDSSSYRWMRTGDVGRMDEEGFLYLTDRKKDLIKYKGFQVPPAELEDVLLSHPLVTEAGVCAVWNEEQGTEVPVGYVNLRFRPEDSSDSSGQKKKKEVEEILEEIKKYHDARVSPYKRLRGGLFHLPGGLPRNPTGKLLRRELPARKGEAVVKAKL